VQRQQQRLHRCLVDQQRLEDLLHLQFSGRLHRRQAQFLEVQHRDQALDHKHRPRRLERLLLHLLLSVRHQRQVQHLVLHLEG